MLSDKKITTKQIHSDICNQLSNQEISQEKINKIIKKRLEKIDYHDIVQIIIGSFAAAFVFAPNNELISISEDLPFHKFIIIFIFSLVFIALLAYGFGGRNLHLKEIRTVGKIIPLRLVLILLISTITCLIALWIYDIINVETSPIIVIRRVVVLLLPATWGGALIDLFYSKNR